MVSLIMKDIFYYRRNLTEYLLSCFRMLLFIIPYYIYSVYLKNTDFNIQFAVLTMTAVNFIMSVIVGINFELYREIISNKMVQFKMSNLSIEKYVAAQSLFYFFSNMVQVVVIIILLSLLTEFKLKFNAFLILRVILFLIYLFLFICLFGAAFSMLTIATKRFSFSGLFINIIFLFSSCYTYYADSPKLIRVISLISPVTYLFNLFRNFFGLESLIFSGIFTYFILSVQLISLYLIFRKLIVPKIDKAIIDSI